MIVKNFDLEKNLKKNINFFLLYGPNSGLIEETIIKTLKPNFSKNLKNVDESEDEDCLIYSRGFGNRKLSVIVFHDEDAGTKVVEKVLMTEDG